MSEGSVTSYGANAALAAIPGASCKSGGCPSCVKSGLPVLLVRAGLVEKNYMQYVQGHMRPLLDAAGLPALRYLNYSFRALKEGYLYAFYEKAHTPEIISQEGWQLNLVDAGGYLTPVPLLPTPLVGVGDIPAFSCERTSGYASAMLFVIPDAGNTGRVWVAYSENPWPPAVLKKYAADEGLRGQRMVCINAPMATSSASLPLSSGTLESLVYDYAPTVSSEAAKASPHQRWAFAGEYTPPLKMLQNTRAENAADIMSAAQEILAQQAKFSESDLMLVLVNDAIGIAHEAAVLRTTMFESVKDYVSRKSGLDPVKGDWMIKSALSLEGLLASFNQAAAQKRADYEAKGYFNYDNTSMMQSQFEGMRNQQMLPEDAIFTAAEVIIKGERFPDVSKPGAVHIPPPELAAEAQIKKVREKLRRAKGSANVAKAHDGTIRDGGNAEHEEFLDGFRRSVDNDNADLLAMEGDYFSCMDCAPRKVLYEHDFDEECVWSGLFYMRTTARICHGGHITGNIPSESDKPQSKDLREGKGVDWYSKYLKDDPRVKENILLRALVGNTSKGFDEWVEKRDGHYGVMGNVLDNIEEQAAHSGNSAAWLKLTAKNIALLKLVASSYVSLLLPVIGGAAYALHFVDKITPATLARISNLVAVVSNASAREARATLVCVTVPLYKAIRIWRHTMIGLQKAASDASRVIRGNAPAVVQISDLLKKVGATQVADAMVDVYLWIDKAPQEMEAWARANTANAVGASAAVRGGSRSLQYAIRLMPGVASSTWTQVERYITSNRLLHAVGKGSKVLASGTTTMAAGAGTLSVLSILKNYEQFRVGSDKEREEAALGMLTGALAFGGAALTLAEDIYKRDSRLIIANSLKLVAGRLVAAATLIDAGVSYTKFSLARKRGDAAGAVVLGIQTLVLLGSGAAALAVATGSTMTILGLSMTGWGLLLALVGIGLTFLYYAIKDAPLETWTARSYWGEASDKFAGLVEEQKALDMLRLGVEIEFDLRIISDSNTPGGKGYLAMLNPLRSIWETGRDISEGDFIKRGVNRDIYFRLRMPFDLKHLIRIHVGIFVRSRSGGDVALLNSYSSGGSGSGLYLGEYPRLIDLQDQVLKGGEEKVENGVVEMWNTSAMRLWKFNQPHAIVWIQEVDKDGEVLEGEAEIKMKMIG